MKTSFYFVIWILIYPVLGLFNNPAINQNSFIIALVVVWGLSWLINRSIPQTIRYEAISSSIFLMEEVYNGRIDTIRRRLARRSVIEFITAVYFGVTFIVVLFSIFTNSDANDWIALVLFGLFAFGAVSTAVRYNKAKWEIVNDPTPETCAKVLRDIYHIDYEPYRNHRSVTSFAGMFPPMPRGYRAFQIFSVFMSIVCVVLGVLYLFRGLTTLIANFSSPAISAGIMYFLYGSLATYFGIRDTISTLSFLRRKIS